MDSTKATYNERPRVAPEVEAFAGLLAQTVDERERRKLMAQVNLLGAKGAPEEAFNKSLPGLDLDLDAPAEPPQWVVEDVIERGTVAILAGDTGAAKSIVSQWLTVQ